MVLLDVFLNFRCQPKTLVFTKHASAKTLGWADDATLVGQDTINITGSVKVRNLNILNIFSRFIF